jgi:hypothetical protein
VARVIIGPRIVAVDDRPDHLQVLQSGFDSLGGLCVGLEFEAASRREIPFVTGVRILFMDINLIPGAGADQGARTFSPIVNVIQKIIAADNGPYALVTWTDNPNSHDALLAYLQEHLNVKLRPCAAFCLSKAEYLEDAPALVERLKTLQSELPGLAMLLDWETSVTNAADRAVFGIVAMTGKTGLDAGDAVAQVVRAIGQAAAGDASAQRRPFRAFTHGMSSVLTDRLDFAAPDEPTEATWRAALGAIQPAQLTVSERSDLNSFFHLALGVDDDETSLGMVFGLPTERVLPLLQPKYGTGKAAILDGEFVPLKGGQLQDAVSKSKFARDCKWRFIQLGASCDHANEKTRVVEGHLGLEVPETHFASTNLATGKGEFRDIPDKKDWLFQTPPFCKEGTRFVVVINLRYRMAVSLGKARNMKRLYRLREGLASEIAVHSANFGTRPGIIEFR